MRFEVLANFQLVRLLSSALTLVYTLEQVLNVLQRQSARVHYYQFRFSD